MSAPIESGSGTSAPCLERDPAAAALEQAAVLEQAHELLGEERVAAAALEDAGPAGRSGSDLAPRRARASSAVSSPESGPRANVLAAAHEAGTGTGQLEHLRAGGRKDEQGDVGSCSARGSP